MRQFSNSIRYILPLLVSFFYLSSYANSVEVIQPFSDETVEEVQKTKVSANAALTLPEIDDATIVGYTTLTLPVATGGVGTKTYSLIGIPFGFAVSVFNNKITVTPNSSSSTGVYPLTLKATDTENTSVYQSFTLIFDKSNLTPSIQHATDININGTTIYLEGGSTISNPHPDADEVYPNIFDIDADGNEPMVWDISQSAKDIGITINASTGAIGGTLVDSFEPTPFFITLTDGNDDVAQSSNLTFVDKALTPSVNLSSIDEELICNGLEPCDFDLSDVMEGNLKNYFSVLPEAYFWDVYNDQSPDPAGANFPEGITFDTSTQTLTVDPLFIKAEEIIDLIYVTTDVDGYGTLLQFDVKGADNSLPILSTQANVVFYGDGSEVLSNATGGNGALNYSLKLSNGSALPEGMNFDGSTRTLSVVNGVATGAYFLNYSVMDLDGDISEDEFILGVTEDTEPTIINVGFFETDGVIHVESGSTVTDMVLFTLDETVDINEPYTYIFNKSESNGSFYKSSSIDSQTGGITATFGTIVGVTATFNIQVIDGDNQSVSSPTYRFVYKTKSPSFDSQASNVHCSTFGECKTILPGASEGNVINTYTLTLANGSELPAGISFVSATQELDLDLSVAPLGETFSVKYQVVDADGDSDSQSFSISTENDLFPMLAEISDFKLIGGQSKELVEGLSGNGDLNYTLALNDGSTLPEDILFNATSRTVSVNDAIASGYYNLKYTVSDQDGDIADQNFTLQAETNALPSIQQNLALSANGTQYYLAPESSYSDLALVDIINLGNEPSVFTINEGSSIAGLSLDQTTGFLSGSVPANFSEAIDITLTITDADNETNTFTGFSFVPKVLSPQLPEISNQTCPTSYVSCSWQLPNATVLGNLENTYTLSLSDGGAIPATIGFEDGIVEYSPLDAEVGDNISLKYTVTDSDGDTDSKNFTISSIGLFEFVEKTASDLIVKDEQYTITYPDPEFGEGIITFSFTEVLPLGLVYDINSSTLSGTPTEVGNFTLILTGTDSLNYVANHSLYLEIQEQQVPAVATIQNLTTYEDENLTIILTQEAGNGIFNYSFVTDGNEGLPSGLSFDANTSTIQGILDVAANYTIELSLSDSDNLEGISDESSQTFTITRIEPLAFVKNSESQILIRTYEAYYSFPEPINAVGEITYVLTGDLPNGLAFNQADIAIEGTPTSQGIFPVVLTATDSNNKSDNFTFTINSSLHSVPIVNEQGISEDIGITNRTGEIGDDLEILLYKNNGNGVVKYAFSSNGEAGLPAGITFSENPLSITGTHTVAGTYLVQVTVSDTDNVDNATDETVLYFTIKTIGFLRFEDTESSALINNGSENSFIFDEALDSIGNVTYSIAQDLPQGFEFNSTTLTLGGVAEETGNFTLVLSAVDSVNSIANHTFTLEIQEPIVPTISSVANITNYPNESLAIILSESLGNGDLNYAFETNGESGLPSGLSFNADNLTISGALITPSTYSIKVTLSDSDNVDNSSDEAVQEFTITSIDLIEFVTKQSSALEINGTQVSISFTAPANAVGNVTYTFAEALPLGLSFNSSTLILEGVPTVIGNFSVVLIATDENDRNDTHSLALSIQQQLVPIVTSVSNLTVYTGDDVSITLNLTEGNGDSTFIFQTNGISGLPQGLSFDAETLTITGALASGGINLVNLELSDSDSFVNADDTSSLSFTITSIDPIAFLVTESNHLLINNSEDSRFIFPEAVNAIGNVTYNLSGTVPEGMAYNSSTFILNGTATEVGQFTLTLTATDNNNSKTADYTFNLDIEDQLVPSVAAIANQSGLYGDNISIALQASGGNGELTFTFETGGEAGLPLGLALNTDNDTIEGQLELTGVFSIKVTVTDSDNVVDMIDESSVNFTITSTGELEFAEQSSSAFMVTEFNNTVVFPAATMITGNAIYSIAQALPEGLTFNASSLVLSGIPTETGNFSIVMSAIDVSFEQDNHTLALEIQAQSIPRLTEISNQTFYPGDSISIALEASSGNKDLKFHFETDGVYGLPTGLVFNSSTKLIEGALSEEANYLVNVTVSDSDAYTGSSDQISQSFTIIRVGDFVYDPAVISTIAVTNNVFNFTLPEPINPNGEVTYNAPFGLPSTVAYNASSLSINGLPTQIGYYPVIVSALDAGGYLADLVLELTVETQAIPSIAAISNRTVTYGENLSIILDGSGGNGDLSYTYETNSKSGLPAGLSFNESNNTIEGIMTYTGSFDIQVTVSDTDNLNDSNDQSVTNFTIITEGVLDFADDEVSTIVVEGSPVSYVLPTAILSFGEVTYTLSENLPLGLSFNASSLALEGIVSELGNFSLVLTAIDTTTSATTHTLLLSVQEQSIPSIAAITNQTNYPGESISFSLDASLGNGELSYGFEHNGEIGLPAGLNFNSSTNTIDGILTVPASYNITVTVSDSDNVQDTTDEGSQSFSIVRIDPLVFETNNASYSYISGAGISIQIPDPVNVIGDISYTLVTDLPSGLVFNSSALTLKGAVAEVENISIVLTATDSNNKADNYTVELTITEQSIPTIAEVADQTIYLGESLLISLDESMGNGEINFAIKTNNVIGLPEGINFNASAKTISGTLLSIGVYEFEITVSDTDHVNDASDESVHNFTIEVLEIIAFETAGTSKLVIEDSAITADFPAPVNTVGSVSYTFAETLPEGLQFNASSRTLSGSVSAAGNYSIVLVASDSSSYLANYTLELNVEEQLIPSIDSIEDISNSLGHDISVVLVEQLGNGPSNYSFETNSQPGLPLGLNFNSETLAIEGVLKSQGDYEIQITVSDSDNVDDVSDESIHNFTITSIKVFEFDESQSNAIVISGSDVSITFAEAVRGEGDISYSISQNLPLGLQFFVSNLTLQGTIEEAGEFSIVLTAIDNLSNEATHTLELSAQEQATPTLEAVIDQSSYPGQAVAIVLNQGGISNGDVDFSFETNGESGLPAGLFFNETSTAIEGIVLTSGIYEISVTLSDNDNVDDPSDETVITFSLEAYAIIDLSAEFGNYSWFGTNSATFTLPQAQGGTGSFTYSLEAAEGSNLPSTLSFNAATRELKGTIDTSSTYFLEYQVVDSEGNNKTFDFSIARELVEPVFANQVSDVSIYEGDSIHIELPVILESLASDYNYTISATPSLPSEVIFNATTHVLNGTFLQDGIYNITYTATDFENNQANLSFTVTAKAYSVPVFESQFQDQVVYLTELFSYVLPQADKDGEVTITYSLSNTTNLPESVSFNAQTRTLSGKYNAIGQYNITLIASNKGNLHANQTFSIQVNDLPAAVFESVFEDQTVDLNRGFNFELPKVNQDPQYAITYEVSDLPSSVRFEGNTRSLIGSFEEVGEYMVNYTATNPSNIKTEQQFVITVIMGDISVALLENILAHQALVIADSSSRVVKDRLKLAGNSRAAYQEKVVKTKDGKSSKSKSANIESKGLHYSLWFDNYGTSLSQSGEFNWDLDSSISQVGFDVSTSNWIAGVLSEGVSSSIELEDGTRQGSYDLSIDVLTLFTGFKSGKGSYWGASSSGSGGNLALELSDSDRIRNYTLSYSALMGGLNYKLSDKVSIGGDYILDATLRRNSQSDADEVEGSASRFKAYIDWQFAQLTSKNGKIRIQPKLNSAYRTDSGAVSQSGIDMGLSSKFYFGDQFSLDAGFKLLAVNIDGGLSETSYWFSAHWQPSSQGFGASLTQSLGSDDFSTDRLLSSQLITQVEANQATEVKLSGELSYRWLAGSHQLKLYSRGTGSQEHGWLDKNRAAESLFSDRIGLEWQQQDLGWKLALDYQASSSISSNIDNWSVQNRLSDYFNAEQAKVKLEASITIP